MFGHLNRKFAPEMRFGVTRSAKITSLMLLHGRCHNRVTFSPFITVHVMCVCVCMCVCSVFFYLKITH